MSNQPNRITEYKPYTIEKWNDYSHKNIDELFEEPAKPTEIVEGEKKTEKLDYYFDSYSHLGIHEDMLKDTIRTKAYQNAINFNKDKFKGKIVQDIGSGTGILSMFAASAGAKHVYGIEMANIYKYSQEIIKENGLSDKITIINGKVEEVELPVDKVDIIISEWMGYFLLYEGMLDSVIFARDKWMNKDGMMFPDRAVLYMGAIEDEDYKTEKLGYWDNVYGLKMSCLKNWAKMEPLVDYVPAKAVVTQDCVILDLDLQTCSVKDLDFSHQYKQVADRTDYIHAFISWFDVSFNFAKDHRVTLSTRYDLKETHWKQVVFYLDDVITVKKGETITGSILLKKSEKNPRELNIKLSYHLNEGDRVFNNTQVYKFA